MGWNDLQRFDRTLTEALDAFDWAGVDDQCQRLVARIRSEVDPFPLDRARAILQKLRRKRRFENMAFVAEALTQSGVHGPRVGIYYSQALIEKGQYAPAESMLRWSPAPGPPPSTSPQDRIQSRSPRATAWATRIRPRQSRRS